MLDYALRLITEPTSEPVTLTELKAHLNIGHTDDDTLLTALITAARRHVEARINRALVRQKWRIYLEQFADTIDLHKQPVLSVDSVSYIDADGVTQVVGAAASPNNASSYYEVDIANGFVRKAYGATWPTPRTQANAVWVDFWAGYTDTSTSPNTRVPADLRIAVMLMAADLYEHREARMDLETYGNPAFEHLIAPYWMPT